MGLPALDHLHGELVVFGLTCDGAKLARGGSFSVQVSAGREVLRLLGIRPEKSQGCTGCAPTGPSAEWQGSSPARVQVAFASSGRPMDALRPYRSWVRRPWPLSRFVTFAGEPPSPFPTGRKFAAGIVKSSLTGRQFANFLIDDPLAYLLG
jgi:hypothetical protein